MHRVWILAAAAVLASCGPKAQTGAEAKYGGLEVSEAKRLRAVEDENGRLKRLLADAMLDNAGLKDLLSKKW